MVNEHVLVVPRTAILPPVGKAFLGISDDDLENRMQAIQTHGFFMDRATAEEDELFKQIIPYFIFHSNDRLFVMERSANANEKRLASKVTLGIGGHVRQEDLVDQHNDLFSWGLREFCEEVSYSGLLHGELLGFINDDTNAVGRVHMGAVFLIHGDSDQIAIRSELASGVLMDFDSCIALNDRMESWSALVVKFLMQRRQEFGSLHMSAAGTSKLVTRVQI